jgi:hypothetical protein
MTFIPFTGKIHFEPIKSDSIFANDKDSLVEAGKVIAVGAGVTEVQPNDIIFFLGYGAEETPEFNGEKYWTVACVPEFLMGFIKHVPEPTVSE